LQELSARLNKEMLAAGMDEEEMMQAFDHLRKLDRKR
jgi:hypothetical protein